MSGRHSPQTDWPSQYKHTPRKGPQFPESTREAWERLQDALDAAPDWSVPCRDDGHPTDWISEDRAAQARAAAACAGCPLIDACRDYASIARRKGGMWGVWGGRHFNSATTQEEPAATAVGA